MLENPTDEQVVRWGNEGDSFVVLEVADPRLDGRNPEVLTPSAEREVYEAHPSETLQA
jgi:hypothetical protein